MGFTFCGGWRGKSSSCKRFNTPLRILQGSREDEPPLQIGHDFRRVVFEVHRMNSFDTQFRFILHFKRKITTYGNLYIQYLLNDVKVRF